MPIVWLHQVIIADELINYGIAIRAVENITDNEGCIASYYSCFD